MTDSADLGTRFSAFMIDAALLFGAQWIAVIGLSRQLQAVGLSTSEPCEVDSASFCEGPDTVLWVLLFLTIVLTTFGYHAFFDGAGATPGKRWMGLRVVDDGGDESIGFGAGLLRSLVRQGVWIWVFLFIAGSPLSVSVPGIVFFGLFGLSVVTFIWGAFAPNGKALHDLVAGSQVVTVPVTHSSLEESLHDRV